MGTGALLTWFQLVFIHLIPWALGYAIAREWLRLQGPGALALTLGIGGVLGMPLLATGLLLADSFLPRLSMTAAASATILVSGAALLLVWGWHRLRNASPVEGAGCPHCESLDRGLIPRLVMIALAALVLIRFASLLPDLTQRPLFPWDAWKTWAWKARVWFENGRIIGFEPSAHWASAPADRYVIEGVDHPDFISLIFLWSALALAEWNDRMIGLAWLLGGIFSTLMTWGCLRFLGLPRLLCWLGAYLLLSLPLVTTHIALFGYADLWMMVFLLLFTVGFLLWAAHGRARFLLVMVLAATVMTVTKDTGAYWFPALILALVATRLSDRVMIVALGAVLAALGSILLLGQDPLALLTGGRYTLSAQPVLEVLTAIGRHMFVWLDWHLLWFLMPAVLAGALYFSRGDALLRALAWLCVLLLGTVFAGFLGTRAGYYATIGTLFNRVLLQIVPAFVLLATMVVWEAWRRSSGSEARAVVDR
jgi:hypothetical protein